MDEYSLRPRANKAYDESISDDDSEESLFEVELSSDKDNDIKPARKKKKKVDNVPPNSLCFMKYGACTLPSTCDELQKIIQQSNLYILSLEKEYLRFQISDSGISPH